MPDLVHGKDVILSANISGNYYPFLCATSCSIQITTELKPKTTVTSGGWREYYSRISEWSMSLDGITTIDGDATVFYTILESVRRTGLDIQMLFTDSGGSEKAFTGHVLIPETSIDGDVADFSKFSISFQGTGACSFDAAPVLNTNDVTTYEYTAGGGETSFSNASLIGRTILWVDRSDSTYTVIPSGTPAGRQVKYTSASGSFQFETALNAGELVKILYQ